MTADDRLEIRLEVDRASDPITGLVHDPRGESEAFVGWLQLMAAVDRTRTAGAEPESDTG